LKIARQELPGKTREQQSPGTAGTADSFAFSAVPAAWIIHDRQHFS